MDLAWRFASLAYAAEPDATIQYFGHNFFQITTSKGTKIVTDPLAPGMHPTPVVTPHVVTVGREHPNHNYVELARGNPIILRGLAHHGAEWNRVSLNVRDVFIYNLPIYQQAYDSALKGAAFMFDLGVLCIVHLGDLSHTLTPEQLNYARLDTRYLIPLHAAQLSELVAGRRLEEAREEFARLTRVKPEPSGSDRHGFWRINGARDLPSPQAAVLRELYLYRERQAERANRPPFKIMNDQTLLEIAQRCPAQTNELQGVMGMTPAQIHRHGAGLLGAVQRGLSAPPPHPPPPAFEPDVVRERYERLRQWRKQKAQARGVESDIIIPREAMWQLARRAPRTPDELAGIAELGPWRRETYGMEILQVLGSADETDKAEASG